VQTPRYDRAVTVTCADRSPGGGGQRSQEALACRGTLGYNRSGTGCYPARVLTHPTSPPPLLLIRGGSSFGTRTRPLQGRDSNAQPRSAGQNRSAGQIRRSDSLSSRNTPVSGLNAVLDAAGSLARGCGLGVHAAASPSALRAPIGLRRLWQMAWIVQSPWAPSRSRRRSAPACWRTFIWPKAGSTIALRLA
jgi:hypothetical protein